MSAAKRVGLSTPFVRIEDLGDFAVTYKVGGLLTDVARLVETHSQLRAAVLDTLHEAGLEIVSPVFETSRAFPPDHVFVPTPDKSSIATDVSAEDKLMFDQASAAAASYDEREAVRAEYEAALKRGEATKDPVERRRLVEKAERLARKLAALGE